MNNMNTLNEIAKFFNGNGGSIRMAIAAVAILGIAGEFMDRNYGIDTDGTKFKLNPNTVPTMNGTNETPELTSANKPISQEVNEVPR